MCIRDSPHGGDLLANRAAQPAEDAVLLCCDDQLYPAHKFVQIRRVQRLDGMEIRNLCLDALFRQYFRRLQRLMPVSYTHLDVYKRQVILLLMKDMASSHTVGVW